MPTPIHDTVVQSDETWPQGPFTVGRAKAIARRQWWVVLLLGIATAAGAAGYVELKAPAYSATLVLATGAPPVSSAQSASSVTLPDPIPDATGAAVIQAAASAAGTSSSAVSVTATQNSTATQVIMTVKAPTSSGALKAAAAAGHTFSSLWSGQLQTLASYNNPQLAALRSELKSLDAQRGATTSPSSANVPTALATEIQVATDQYAALYNQQLEYTLAARAAKSSRLAAASVHAVSSSKAEIVLIALGAGLLAGSGIALFLDVARDRFSEPGELPELAEVPLLAELPTVRRKRTRPLLESFDGQLGEAVRGLRATLTLPQQRRQPRVLLVTSAATGEGKSFTVANLAIAYALSGAKTLLISSDLRHPTVERMLGADNSSAGLTTLLGPKATSSNGFGHADFELQALLVPTPLKALHVLPAGSVEANPVELLSSRAMEGLMEQARAEFEVVLFDSPPLLAVADATVLGRFADAVLLVVSSGRSTKKTVRRALELMERNRTDLVGFVLDRSSRVGMPSYRYGRTRLSLPGPGTDTSRAAAVLERH